MPQAPVVIVMTSNGVGMGHLSRQLATVLAAGGRMRAVVLSLSKALPRVMAAARGEELPEARDVRFEYCPSWESPWLSVPGRHPMLDKVQRRARWAPYLRERIVALARETGASALVFDGVAPYPGLVQARAALPGTRFVWVRRGMWHPAAPVRRLDASRHFDLTVTPGEAGGDRGPTARRTDARVVAPVSLTSALRTTTRAEARTALGLPAEGPVLLLAPGAGALGSVDDIISGVLAELRGTGWHVALTRQTIARHGPSTGENLTVLDDVYPLARHLAAFDAAVGAAGYNAVHELTSARVPSLFVPTTGTTTDDQVARAAGLVERGAALSSDGTDLPRTIARLLDATEREHLTTACGTLPAADGAAELADLVVELAQHGTPAHGPLAPRAPRPSLVRRPRGAEPTEHVDVTSVRGPEPVEHVLAGSSPEYVDARRTIARWVYSP